MDGLTAGPEAIHNLWSFMKPNSGGSSECDWQETVPRITWSQAIKGFKGDNQRLELRLEAY